MEAEHKKSLSVAGTVWPWQEDDEPQSFDPKSFDGANGAGKKEQGKAVQRRKRSLIEAAVVWSIGFIFFRFGKHIAGSVVLCMGTVVFIGGWLIAPLYYGFKGVGSFLARVVGVGLSWILLVPFFYICFTIGRFFLVVLRKDPLKRKFPGQEKSYWVPRKPVTDLEHYKRQY
ncbi:hypothetical protein ACFLS1_03105 [Verrucomicrobiota bacterium]